MHFGDLFNVICLKFGGQIWSLILQTEYSSGILAYFDVLLQATASFFSARDVRVRYAIEKRAVGYRGTGQNCQPLHRSIVHLVVYSDGSFDSNHNVSSQFPYISLLVDTYGRVSITIIHFDIENARSELRSVLGADISAFYDSVDFAILLRHDLEAFLKDELPLRVMTKITRLFPAKAKSTTTTERQVCINCPATLQVFEHTYITEIGWIWRERNLADGRPKMKIIYYRE